MKDYTIENGQYYKVTDKDTKSIISFGELKEGDVLSTIHKVEFINDQEFMKELNKIVDTEE